MDMVQESRTLGILRFLSGPLAGTTYPLTKPMIMLGRETSNDIVITDRAVSRQHAQLIYQDNAWIIKKLNAQNSLTLNTQHINQSLLKERDTVGLGPDTTFCIEFSGQLNVPAPQGQSRQPGRAAPVAPSSPIGPPQQGQPSVPAMASAAQRAQVADAPSPHEPTMRASAPVVMPGAPVPASYPDARHTEFLSERAPLGVASLEVSTNTDADRQVYPLAPERQYFDIGRDGANAIVINRPTVSSFHAQIVREGPDLVLIHPHPSREKTVNGITYQGRTIGGSERFRHVLRHGDVFRISDDQEGTFVSLIYNDGSGRAQDMPPEIRPIPLGRPVITLGRASDNTVSLDHPQVSSHHARLEQIPTGYRILDLNSTNHTFVNARRINTHELRPGDEIRIGPFKLTYTGTELTQQDESKGIRIDALHLVRRGTNGVVLLNDISFAIPARKFVALVGGSGAGKSTLMNALNGSRPADEGGVLYNGQDYYSQLDAFSTQLGYVPQDDIIHRDLSVERALYYAAKLRLPEDFTEEQIQQRIEEVLEDVEMRHRRNLLISQLSGGQRKRVSIALELLAKPAVFFLDEPTSGLDPGLDRKMMLLLRKLADKGHTVVLVTHATNNINACDYVCFLSQGGRLVYFGPPDGAKAYFGRADFAQIYSSLEPSEERPHAPEEAEAHFKQAEDYVRYIVEPLRQGPAGQRQPSAATTVTRPPGGNPWKQFVLLSRRYLELIFNDRVNLAILILQAPVIGIILFLLMKGSAFSSISVTPCMAPADVSTMSGPLVIQDCQGVVNALNTPDGKQFAIAQGKTPQEELQESMQLAAVHTPGVIPGADAQKVLFIMAFAAIVFGCLNGSREIVKESAIYRRERAVNLGLAPYLCSKIAVLGAFSLLQSLILVLLIEIRSPFGQTQSILFPAIIEIYITLALTALAGLMTGLLISAIVPNNDRAMSLVPLPLIPQVIFAGVVFKLDDPAILQIPGAIFPVRWAIAAMGSTVGLHGDLLNMDAFSFQGLQFTDLAITNDARNAAILHLLLCWGVLALMIVVQAAVIVWCMKRKDVRR